MSSHVLNLSSYLAGRAWLHYFLSFWPAGDFTCTNLTVFNNTFKNNCYDLNLFVWEIIETINSCHSNLNLNDYEKIVYL